MKKLFCLLIGIVILAVTGYFTWNQPAVDSTGKIHTEIYNGASGTWNPEVQSLPFRPQDVDGQTVGSSTAIRLEWKQPTETYNHFLLTITNPATNTSIKESGEHDRVSLDITGLKPDTEYVFALQACFDPRCETWIVAENEILARTPQEFWSQDDEPVLLNP